MMFSPVVELEDRDERREGSSQSSMEGGLPNGLPIPLSLSGVVLK